MTTKAVNHRQARWVQELASIDFRIYYRPGSQNGKPDALSRCSEYCPEKGGVENQPIKMVLGKNHFEERLASAFICSSVRRASLQARKWNEEFITQLREEVKTDKEYQQVRREQEAAWAEPVPKDRKVKEGIWEICEELLYRKGMLWVPEGLVDQVLQSEHDTKVARHMGQDKTIELVRRNFW